MKQKVLTSLFILLYVAVGFVSCWHAIEFFSVANERYLGVILAVAFEIGQACVLVYLLIYKSKSIGPWALMVILTLVQCVGNVFSSHMYLVNHSQDKIQYFVDSVLFFVADPDIKFNIVMIDYMCGFILPIVALSMTSLIVRTNATENKDMVPIKMPDSDTGEDESTINPRIFL